MAVFKENITAVCDDDKYIYCEYQSQRYANKIRKYKELYPDDVIILSDNVECLSAKLNKSRFNFSMPKVKREMTDEQKEQARQRLQKIREENNE